MIIQCENGHVLRRDMPTVSGTDSVKIVQSIDCWQCNQDKEDGKREAP